jgi:hypothetical protein
MERAGGKEEEQQQRQEERETENWIIFTFVLTQQERDSNHLR